MWFLGTIGKNTSRSSRSGNGLSVMMWTVSASTIFTSLIARMLPYWGDFLVWSMTRSKEYFTSAGVMTSPLWKRTPLRILNSHWVSESGFQEVASDGSNSSLVFRCSSESNMLMFTRIPTRSKCMWGSRVGAWDTRATVRVSLAWAVTAGGTAASATSARTRAAASGAHRFMRMSSSVSREPWEMERAAVASALAERIPRTPHRGQCPGNPLPSGRGQGEGRGLRRRRRPGRGPGRGRR